jgi:nucleotide-binding universal stress UspA family protein
MSGGRPEAMLARMNGPSLASTETSGGSGVEAVAAANEPDQRPTHVDEILRRVLVATDMSPTSSAAERAGIELSSRVGAGLVLLSVIDSSRLRLPGGLFHSRVDQIREQRESALQRIVARAREVGVAAQFMIWEGDPGTSVIEAAEAEGADIIIVGSHGRGPLGRRLLGSVSSYVVEHGRLPVIVIQPGQQLDEVWPVITRDDPGRAVSS